MFLHHNLNPIIIYILYMCVNGSMELKTRDENIPLYLLYTFDSET